MSKVYDQWVSMAMADDTLVAHQLLLFRHRHQSSVNPWTCRQRRTTRYLVRTSPSPATPLTRTAVTSRDGSEGSTHPTAPMRSSESKPVDKSATSADKTKNTSSKKKRMELLSRLALETGQAVNVQPKPKPLEAEYSPSDIAPAQDQMHENQSPASEAASVSEAATEIKEPVSEAATTAPSNERKSGGQQPRIFLPDLNEAPMDPLSVSLQPRDET
ncbi:unnamed protein product [Sphenostylis stenocarpa]|uniref:Uncharacterized protein n=1 Tax=Sphenostylis stenocarpa TaxID=92480 RepID=A0AA86VNN0_9FABA|nr:unnamed protein product [Sphenostylis stenocarpa]